MAVVSVLSLLTGLYFLHRSVHCGIIPRAKVEVPFKVLCSRKCEPTQEQPASENFPLYQCSCSQSCSTYGDCCYDSTYKNTTVWYNRDFVCLSVIGHGKYRAVSGCPPDRLADFCKDGLGYLPPVTSRVTNITYANVFCATCNGDKENLVYWKVEMRCPSEFDNETEENSADTTRIIYNLGDFWKLNEADGSKRLCMFHVHFDNFSFTEGLELRQCDVNVRKISDCSASWKDLVVMQMCRSYEDPVYFHNTLYQNSHCAECNYLNPVFADCIPFYVKNMMQLGLADSNFNRFCRTRGSDACVQYLSMIQKGKAYPFASLVNINEKACVPLKGKRCCEGQSFDFRSRKCRKVVH